MAINLLSTEMPRGGVQALRQAVRGPGGRFVRGQAGAPQERDPSVRPVRRRIREPRRSSSASSVSSRLRSRQRSRMRSIRLRRRASVVVRQRLGPRVRRRRSSFLTSPRRR